MLMNAELRQFIERSDIDRESVQQLQTLLPADHAELDGWLTDAIENNAARGFTFLTLAAITAKRFVDARHLVKGAGMLVPHYSMVSVVARMQGDVPEYLIEAIVQDTLDPTNKARALFLAAVWCRDCRNSVFPEQLIPLALSLATRTKMSASAEFCLAGIAVTTNDSVLIDLLEQRYREALGRDGDDVLNSQRAQAG